MALQTKTFSWGSYTWQSESNAYVLELTLTEDSTSVEENTSSVTYVLTLKSGAQNRFQCDVKSTLKLNGVSVASKTENRYLNYNQSWTLLSGTTSVAHDDDGNLNMPIEVSIDTTDSNQYAPPDKTINWSWTLTNIPRASSFGTITGTTLGGKMRVNINRNSTKFSHTVWYYKGNDQWSEGFQGDTYVEFELPLSLATLSPNASSFSLRLFLRTYNGSTQIGDVITDISVTIPENDTTRPTVTMVLEPVNDFGGLYLERRTRVKIKSITATGKYGTSIKSYSFKVDGKTYDVNDISDPLIGRGNVKVEAVAVDNRGITGSTQQTVMVLPYSAPLVSMEAYRCDFQGTKEEAGDCLKIKATVWFTSVSGNNRVSLWYQYRSEMGEYSDEVMLSNNVVSGQSIETEPLLKGSVQKEKAYRVRIIAKDSVGEKAIDSVLLYSEQIYKHKRAGGRGLGLGGYCGEDDFLDVHWNARIRKGIILGQDVGSVYISTTEAGNPREKFGGEWKSVTEGVPEVLKMWVRTK